MLGQRRRRLSNVETTLFQYMVFAGLAFRNTSRPFGYERVYLPLHKVPDTPFHIQGDYMFCPVTATTSGPLAYRLKLEI